MVLEYVNGESTTYLRKKYGYKTNKSVIDKVKKYGYTVRSNIEEKMKNKLHRDFSLEKIDNLFKAYYLGLLVTDGYVVNNAVGLDLVDKDVIEFISHVVKKPYSTYVQKEPNQTKYRIRIDNPQLVYELKRYGVEERKSKTIGNLSLYEDEYKYLPYIIRGIIDGDGWIRKDGKEFFICSASQTFIQCLKTIMEERLYMRDLNIIKKTEMNQSITYVLRTSLIRNINILKYIVYDIPYGMQRKYNLVHGKPSETIMEDTL